LLLGGICGHMRALCLKESVQWHGGKPQWTVKNVWFFEGENSSGAERVKSHGQYWVGRDKIVHNLLEGTRYRGIEMWAKMASEKGALGIIEEAEYVLTKLTEYCSVESKICEQYKLPHSTVRVCSSTNVLEDSRSVDKVEKK
ncbi:hypothetical protein T4D_5223, partial [Trichinella pseudospiralis]